jgi:arginyl-tRNA synthetase
MDQEAIAALLRPILDGMGAGDADIRVERPRDPEHGDWATNVAMTLAGRLGRPPRSIAEEIASAVGSGHPGVDAVEVAGPGFLNFRLSAASVADEVATILEEGGDFGRSDDGCGNPVMIAALLEWTGWRVHREYYYNDAGAQIDRLAESVRARYHEHFGHPGEVPEGGYQGEYVREVAAAFAQGVGDRWLDDESPVALDAIREFAVRALREVQDRDLAEFRVHFDQYFLESSLYAQGSVDQTVEELRGTGMVYERDGAVWLRTTEFGDQKDRVMIRGNGLPTYFLPDVAYHRDKWNRGFRHVINVQGSDHHGTVARVQAGLQALGLPKGYPEYVLHQMVRVERDGREVKFSKRAGSYVTLRDLCDEVGVDVTRYFMQMRKAEGHLVFDLDMALDQSDKNPVYKVQYAHARMCSIFRKAGFDHANWDGSKADLSLLADPVEKELIKSLSAFPEVVQRAAQARAPHLICEYLEQTAGAVNSWYHSGNPARNPELAVLVDDSDLRTARLALAKAVSIVLFNGLAILGIVAPDRMDREEA